ncbi:ATP-grasp domain-containing protein [bacterium]|nr:ATP-grasp domain-containing protein [bacterium]
MKNIVIICPTNRDFREIEKISTEKQYRHYYIFYGQNPRENLSAFDPIRFIEKFHRDFKGISIDGIIATHDYPSSILASILSEKLGIRGVGIFPNLICQHKYYGRIYQKRAVPDAVPEFFLVDPSDEKNGRPPYFPIFIKPVNSFFSIFATRINNLEDYIRFIRSFRKHNHKFSKPFNILLKKYSDLEINADYLIAEKLLNGRQVTLEGYVHNKKIEILGITDSIMYPGTISFKRFDYPSSLAIKIQVRIIEITKSFISSIGFDNGIFNIEFFYDRKEDKIKIIEANPRMASQFADLMEKVEGINTYKIQVDLSLGKKPRFKKNSGKFKYATSFVLRSFEDKRIIRLPDRNDMEKVLNFFPEARIEIYGKEGNLLSEQLQDMQSYRYGIINLGGNSKQELNDKFQQCIGLLKFDFKNLK